MEIVNFTKSVFWGSDGKYKIPFTNGDFIHFQQGKKTSETDKNIVDLFNRYVFENKFFQVATLGYMILLAQGVGYDVATRIFASSLRKENNETIILTGKMEVVHEAANRLSESDYENISSWKKSICAVAGTIASIAFSSFKLLLALALRSYITTPVAALLIIGSVIYISTDLIECGLSFFNGEEEGLGYIRKKSGTLPAVIAGAVIVSQCALTVFFAANVI